MPPLLMTLLFSILLNWLVPQANIALPHAAHVTSAAKIANVAPDISFD